MKTLKLIIIKIIIVLSVLIMITSMFSTVFGDDNFATDPFEENSESNKLQDLAENSGKTTVAVLRVASVTISIIVLLVIAMKYMISAPGDRADIKKHAVAYVIGTFILFSAAQIIALLIDIADKTFSTDE